MERGFNKMKKEQKVYYYEYDEENEQLKIVEDTYTETKNGLLILKNIYIPRSMVHTNKRFISFNCKIINKKLSKLKGDKFLYVMPFVTGVYKNIFHKIIKNIWIFIIKIFRLYFIGTLKLPFIPFIRYFENRKEMTNIKAKINLLEKSKEHYKQLAEAKMPQTEKDVFKMLGGTSFDTIKKQYSTKYNQIQIQSNDLKEQQKKIKEQEIDLSNMTFSLIISFSSLVVAIIALVITCRQPTDKSKIKEQGLENTKTSVSYEKTTADKGKSNDKDSCFSDNESELNKTFEVPYLLPPDLPKNNLLPATDTPIFKEYKESTFKK